MEFAESDVVTVADEDDPYFDKQGEIVDVINDNHPEGPVKVSIEHLRQRYERSGLNDLTTYEHEFRFFPEQLKKSEWDLETRIIRLFGSRMWHSWATLDLPLDSSKLCMSEDCDNQQEEAALVNYWGTVYEFYLCTDCKEKWHGKCSESVPSKH